MYRFILKLLLVYILAVSTAATEDLHPFERMDVFGLEWVSNPKISPDGRRIVYVRNSMDIMTDRMAGRLWLINVDGGGNVPLTGRDVAESKAAWSPDGTRIAFTSETDNGSELFVYWVDGGKIARLTQLDRKPGDLSWSPDGQQIAFAKLVPEEAVVMVSPPAQPKGSNWSEPPRVTTRLKYERDGSGYLEPGYLQYFVIPAHGGTPRQITQGAFRHSGKPVWSRDGESVIISGNRNPDWETDFANSELYRVSIDTGRSLALTDRDGPDHGAVVSPDDRKIAYLSYEDKSQAYQVTKLHVMNSDGSGKKEILVDLDRSVSALVWNKTSNGLYFQYDDQGDTKIAFTSLSGRMRDLATNVGGTTIGRPYGGGSFSVSRSGTIAYTHVTPHRPAELAVVDGRVTRVVTDYSGELLKWRDLASVEEIWYQASTDGRDIQGWLVKPPGFDEDQVYPLLVENHGGPAANYGARFSPEMQLYAAAGYVVFYPNPRGSTSYGEEFGNLLFDNYPGDDYVDIMDGVDVLLESGITADDRLYVTGGSAGGIMTAWIIGKNTRFSAAAVVKPVMNWISKTLTADNYYAYANRRFRGQPWENIEGYMAHSPVSLVGNIETPTMVMVGTADLRTPVSESKQLYSALKIRGIETALVEVPDAPHNISRRPSQLITKIDHVLAWFAKYSPDSGSPP